VIIAVAKRELRLVQIGEGVLTSAVGLGISLAFLLISWITREDKILTVSALGLLVLLIGLGLIVSALWFTVLPKASETPSQRIPAEIVAGEEPKVPPDKEVPAPHPIFHSISEGTTREL
jgi:hypothetical protein